MTCPLCKGPTTWEGYAYRPFCSERCKLIDLGRWASGQYRIPGHTFSTTSTDHDPASAASTEPSDQTE